MNSNRKILGGALVAAFVFASVTAIFSQQKQPTGDTFVFQKEKVIQGPEGPPLPPGDENFVFVSNEMSFDGKLVKGAPYSAEAVTEMTQTLSDGNRIVNKSSASIYRDSEGRTRREQTLRALGPFATAGEPPQTIFISDPVAQMSFMLDARTHVARKMPSFHFEVRVAGPGGEGIRVNVPPDGPAPPGQPERGERIRVPAPADGPAPPALPERGEGIRVTAPGDRPAPPALPEPGVENGDVFVMTTPPAPGGAEYRVEYHGGGKRAQRESLGKQIIEGVEAEGTRTTVTIAAGEIGNERAIEIVNERWYSAELQVVVMTKRSDPRAGETVYKLTNINRSEPAKSLFEIPADYTVKTGSSDAPTVHPLRTRKPGSKQEW